jgi:hypothetical protein
MGGLRNILVIVVSVFVLVFIFQFTEAGSLTPSVAPAGTLHSLENIWAPIASSGYDSSGVVASKNGNALQIAKCIIQAMTGGSICP